MVASFFVRNPIQALPPMLISGIRRPTVVDILKESTRGYSWCGRRKP